MRSFGPFFIRFGLYFPYTAKVCLNGCVICRVRNTRGIVVTSRLSPSSRRTVGTHLNPYVGTVESTHELGYVSNMAPHRRRSRVR